MPNEAAPAKDPVAIEARNLESAIATNEAVIERRKHDKSAGSAAVLKRRELELKAQKERLAELKKEPKAAK